MPQIKEFLIQQNYVANYGHGERYSETHFSVPVSSYSDTIQQLKKQLSNPLNLEKLLQQDFIYPGSLGVRSDVTYNSFPKKRYRPARTRPNSDSYRNFQDFMDDYIENPNYGCGQRDTSIIAKYKVAPVLEELVVNHPEDFIKLLEEADEAGKKVLMNFTDLDLSHANVAHLDLRLVNFKGCDLRMAHGITQEVLDTSLTYLNAKLPEELIPFWSDDKKNAVLAQIQKLFLYGDKLGCSHSKEGRIKGQLTKDLANQLKIKITQTSKFNGRFQRELLDLLGRHHKVFEKKRDHGLKMIISNLILCILGAGVGYLAAGIIHQHQTGQFLFFQRTKTTEKIADIQSCLSVV